MAAKINIMTIDFNIITIDYFNYYFKIFTIILIRFNFMLNNLKNFSFVL